jgi:hypothetical protein
MEDDDIRKVINAIGGSKLPLNEALIEDLRRTLVEKGYDSAVVFAEQTYLADR